MSRDSLLHVRVTAVRSLNGERRGQEQRRELHENREHNRRRARDASAQRTCTISFAHIRCRHYALLHARCCCVVRSLLHGRWSEQCSHLPSLHRPAFAACRREIQRTPRLHPCNNTQQIRRANAALEGMDERRGAGDRGGQLSARRPALRLCPRRSAWPLLTERDGRPAGH